jgi:regulation of enolase protein 1 (concanavalin A-like superfamily)
MHWLHEPREWRSEGSAIVAKADPHTDFWRKTHDGGTRDSGHFCFQQVTGDFTAEVKLSGEYAALYDHAGLMIRLDETTWLKCGIEFFDGVQHASVVVTHDYSDWSILPWTNAKAMWLRAVRHGGTIEIYASADGKAYDMIRQCYLTAEPSLSAGIMICAPTGDGFTARFEDFSIT